MITAVQLVHASFLRILVSSNKDTPQPHSYGAAETYIDTQSTLRGGKPQRKLNYKYKCVCVCFVRRTYIHSFIDVSIELDITVISCINHAVRRYCLGSVSACPYWCPIQQNFCWHFYSTHWLFARTDGHTHIFRRSVMDKFNIFYLNIWPFRWK